MKKAMFALLAVFFIISSLFACTDREKDKDNTSSDPVLASLDFVNEHWDRRTEYCTETIYFNDDGSCGYYCGCGEPVDDSDCWEGYTYDKETNTIHLIYSDEFQGALTKIIVKSCAEDSLVLDFNGEVRIFEKAVEYDTEPYADTIEYKGNTYDYLSTPMDLFYYDLYKSVDCEEDERVPIPHEKWDLVYCNGDLFVLSSQTLDAVSYYADSSVYSWYAVIDDPDGEASPPFPITVSDEDSEYIFEMDAKDKNTTLAFDDIEIFGTLMRISDDGLIAGSTSLAYSDGVWYWRSEVIDDSAEGWPEFVVPLPDSISHQLTSYNN